MNFHQLAIGLKKLFIGSFENFLFVGYKLKFLTGTRPIKRKYKNSDNDIVRNDVFQINYFKINFHSHDVF